MGQRLRFGERNAAPGDSVVGLEIVEGAVIPGWILVKTCGGLKRYGASGAM